MGLIRNLNNTLMVATYLSVNQPSDSRTVIAHDYDDDGNQVSLTCQYRNGQWRSVVSGADMTKYFSGKAIWSECLLGRL